MSSSDYYNDYNARHTHRENVSGGYRELAELHRYLHDECVNHNCGAYRRAIRRAVVLEAMVKDTANWPVHVGRLVEWSWN